MYQEMMSYELGVVNPGADCHGTCINDTKLALYFSALLNQSFAKFSIIFSFSHKVNGGNGGEKKFCQQTF